MICTLLKYFLQVILPILLHEFLAIVYSLYTLVGMFASMFFCFCFFCHICSRKKESIQL